MCSLIIYLPLQHGSKYLFGDVQSRQQICLEFVIKPTMEAGEITVHNVVLVLMLIYVYIAQEFISFVCEIYRENKI